MRAVTVLLPKVSQRVQPLPAALLVLRGAVLSVLVGAVVVLIALRDEVLLFSW